MIYTFHVLLIKWDDSPRMFILDTYSKGGIYHTLSDTSLPLTAVDVATLPLTL